MRSRAWLVLSWIPLLLVQTAFVPLRPASSAPGKLSGASAQSAYRHLSQAIQHLHAAGQPADGSAAPWIVAAHRSVSAALPLFANSDESVRKRLSQVQDDLAHPEELSLPEHRDLLARALGDLHAVIDSQQPASPGILAEERLSLTPNTFEFGEVCINVAVRLTATLKNETAVERHVDFNSALPSQLSVVSGLPATVAPGATVDVTIEFLSPTPVRLVRGVRLVGTALGQRPADIFVNFRARAAVYLFSPNPVDFGEVGIGDTATSSFTIRNCTSVDAPMTVKLDDFENVFALDGGTQLPVTVPATGTLSFSVSFTPKRIGKDRSQVSIQGRINGRMREIGSVELTGVGVAAVEVGARTLDFGTVPSGQLALRHCFFFNNTNLTQTVMIDGSHLPKTGPWGALGTGTRTLSPKDTGSVLVSFQSTRRGASKNKLIFTGAGIPRRKAILTLKARVR